MTQREKIRIDEKLTTHVAELACLELRPDELALIRVSSRMWWRTSTSWLRSIYRASSR